MVERDTQKLFNRVRKVMSNIKEQGVIIYVPEMNSMGYLAESVCVAALEYNKYIFCSVLNKNKTYRPFENVYTKAVILVDARVIDES